LDAVGLKGITLHVGTAPAKNTVFVNQGWFLKMTALFFGLISCLLLLYEILLLCNPFKFGYGRTGIARSIYYIFLGISSMGLAADLGVASGIIMMFSGAVTLIVFVLIQCGALRDEEGKDQGFSAI
jgi:uncharacterized membrane protein